MTASAQAGQILITLDLKLGSTDFLTSLALKNYLQLGLKNKYRKIYIVAKSSGFSTREAVLQIKSDRQKGESLDIVSFQHGPDISLFWDISVEEFQKLLGTQNIRYVFSSGCKMWGTVHFNSNGVVVQSQRNHIVDRVQALHPKEAILFVNNQSYTTHLLDAILKLNEHSNNFKEIFLNFFVQEDLKNEQSLNKLSEYVKDENWISAYWANHLSVNPLARPVFIEPTDDGYQETLYTIPNRLWTSVLNLCSNLNKTQKLRYQQMAQAICRF